MSTMNIVKTSMFDMSDIKQMIYIDTIEQVYKLPGECYCLSDCDWLWLVLTFCSQVNNVSLIH